MSSLKNKALAEAFSQLTAVLENELRGRLDEAGRDAQVSSLSEQDRAALSEGWPKEAPLPLTELRALDFRFRRIDGAEGCGRLLLPARFSAAAIERAGGLFSGYAEALEQDPSPRFIAEECAAILGRLYQRGELILDAALPLHHLRPLVGDWGEELDQLSMALNNSSASHPRPIRDTGRWSRHCVGALDLNPAFNPLVLWRGADAPHADTWTRSDLEAGRLQVSPAASAELAFPAPPLDPRVLTAEGAVVAAFRAADWSWGGAWGRLKDRQHFSPGQE